MEKVVDAVVEFLEEAYSGPKHEYTWFIGNAPDSGLLGTVNGLSAGEASTPVVEGGTTVAAHVGHLRWTLLKVNSFLRGEKPSWNWSESWAVKSVGEEEWRELIGSLEAELGRVLDWLHSGWIWRSDEEFKEVLALIPHAAYHLGAVRQMVLLVREAARRRDGVETKF